MKKFLAFLCIAAFLFGVTGSSSAALIDRGNGMIYDTVQDITWLQDANYAKTSGYDSDGRMTWSEAMTWASGLTFGGYDDWRLASSYNSDGSGPCGGACDDSEMGHLYFVDLGGSTYWNNPGNYPFLNVQDNTSYGTWSSTEYVNFPTEIAWVFDFWNSSQGTRAKATGLQAWAVRDGDVAVVPIPGAVWLLGSGLIGLIRLRKKFRKT